MNAAFASAAALRGLRRPRAPPSSRWRCCVSGPHPTWDLAPPGTHSRAPGRPRRREPPRHRSQTGQPPRSYQDRPSTRRPSTDPETLLIRDALDSGDELLYGVSPVLLALESGRRPQYTALFVQQKMRTAQKPENVSAIAKIHQLATGKQLAIHTVSKGGLNALCDSRPHQGVVLQTAAKDMHEMSSLGDANTGGVWVALDQVTDPHNAGAIIRSAAFLGAAGVVICRRNSCSITPAVCKASAGATEMVSIRGVTSMPRFLNRAQGDGWKVVGLAADEDAINVRDVVVEHGTIVVIGSEGRGLRTLVRAACDDVVAIVGHQPALDAGIDSLNVSVATGVALFQLLGGRAIPPPSSSSS